MIRMDGVTKTFRSGRGKVTALGDISLAIAARRFAAVIGKSGSGKSTLLHCLGGLEPPDCGSVTCFGTPIYTLSTRSLSLFQRENMGFVFQRGNLLSSLNVTDNIGFPLTLKKITGKRRIKRIEELLERIELSSAARALPRELSGGEMQRVAIARAVAHYPKLLLADEPTASLDTETGRRAVALMQDLGRDDNCTIIMVTHDLDITKSADLTIYLQDGHIYREERL